MAMNNETLVFERTSNLKVLSSFFCGVRKIDYVIHSRSQTQGLQCFLEDTNNQLIVVYDQNETPVALFVCHLAIEETFQGNRIIKQLDLIAVRNDKQRNGIGRQISITSKKSQNPKV